MGLIMQLIAKLLDVPIPRAKSAINYTNSKE